MVDHVLNIRIAGKIIATRIVLGGPKLEVHFPYTPALLEQIKAMAGSEWKKERNCWLVDNCKRNWFAFDMLIRGPRSKRFLENPPDFAPNFKKSGTSFMVHQYEAYCFERFKRRCLLGAEPRTGKTLPTLQCFYDSPFDLCFWITTCSAMLGSVREMRKWFNADLKYRKSDLFYDLGGPAGSHKTIMLISYDYLSSHIDELLKATPGFIIFDECHKLKNANSARSKAADLLSLEAEEVYKDEEYVLGLSGTPAPLDITDWWNQCEIIRRGFIREGTVSKFKGRYGTYKPWDGSTPAWERFEGFSKEKVMELAPRLRGLVKIFFLKDCIDLPPIRYERVRLKAPKSLLRVAKLITETSNGQLEVRKRLRQLSDGFEYEKEYNEDRNEYVRSGSQFLGSAKIEQLKQDIEEYEEVGRMVVYAAFTASIDIVRKVFLSAGWHVLQLNSDKALWTPDGVRLGNDASIQLGLDQMDRSTNDYKIPKLAVVADTGSGGTGLEMSASPITIYYSNNDNGEGRMQSRFRTYSLNMDKERGCTIKDYILLHTDEKILDQQEGKQEMQDISMGDFASIINKQLEESTEDSETEY